MDWQPITLRKCSRGEMDFSNRFLFASGGKTEVLVDGNLYPLHLSPYEDNYHAVVAFRCRVGDGSVSVYLNESALGSLLSNIIPASSFSALPEDLRLALLSAAMFSLEDTLKKRLKMALTIECFETLSEVTVDGLLVKIEPPQEVAPQSIVVSIDDPLAPEFIEWLQTSTQAPLANNYTRLTLPVDLQLGYVSLRASDIESLKFGDIMLMSVNHFSEGCLRVNISDYFSCLGQIEGSHLVIQTELEKTLEEEFKPLETADIKESDEATPEHGNVASEADADVSLKTDIPPEADADSGVSTENGEDSAREQKVVPDMSDLPVNVFFVAGRFNLSLKELQSIQPGYVFDLKKDARQEIEIRVNGADIARGELVEVDGRTGVRVIECK